MSLLSACQSAALRLVGTKPSSIVSSSDLFEMELLDLAQEGARDIAKSHDWQALTKTATITGDGTTTDFDLPTDYDRMLIRSDMIDTTSFLWGYSRITDINDYIWETEQNVAALPGSWIIFGDQFHFVPAPQSAAVATYAYITTNVVRDEADIRKAAFTADSDGFVLSERLLTLWMVWRWREMKRLDYDDDKANFEKAFAELSGRDKGSRIIRTGPLRFPGSVSASYPWSLGS